jgi:hypothetical protein
MAGALDSLFKSVAKDVVAELGTSLDTTVTYTRKATPTYNTSTGAPTPTTPTSKFLSNLWSPRKRKAANNAKPRFT